MKRFVKILIFFVSLLLLTTTAFGVGVATSQSGVLFGPSVVRATEEPSEFAVFWQAWDIVHRHFVDRSALDPTQLTYGAIRGMVNALGDEGHTTFLTPEEFSREQTDISGEFSGIGAQLGVKDHLPIIIAPFDGSPAAQAGVKAGDIILKVNGEDVTTLSLNEIAKRVRGKAGTKVVLTVLHPNESESQDITIIRGDIKLPAATWAMIPGTHVALIRMSQFNANLEDDVKAAITEAKASGATALILDERNNPGGLLDQAIKVTSQFLKDGNVLQQADAEGHRQIYPVEPGGIAPSIPIVVLINGGTASAAEIFAGAIQDHQRGTLIGETTFGTGTVLEPFKLEDGSALLLGTSEWLTPNGRLIYKHGIEPDIKVELSPGADLLTPANLKNLTATEVQNSTDTQLLKALEVLKATSRQLSLKQSQG